MTLSFEFNKRLRNFFLFGLIIWTMNIAIEIVLSGAIISTLSKKPVTVFFMTLGSIGYFRMFTRDYLIIANNKIFINYIFFPNKEVIEFKDIKNAKFVKPKIQIKIIPLPLVLFFKNGKRSGVNFINLSKEDRIKVIEVFREKGLLQE